MDCRDLLETDRVRTEIKVMFHALEPQRLVDVSMQRMQALHSAGVVERCSWNESVLVKKKYRENLQVGSVMDGYIKYGMVYHIINI